MITYFSVIAVSALYGGIRNYLSQKSFSSHASLALLVLLPLATVVLMAIRLHSLENMDSDEFIPLHLLIPALLLLFPGVWCMGAISSAVAFRLDFISNLLICLAVFLVGLVSQYFLFLWFGDSWIEGILGSILPNWQYFWMADALTNMVPIPAGYIAWTCLYVFLHIIVWTFWAVFLFQDEELARDSR